jgi:hypothetical protein
VGVWLRFRSLRSSRPQNARFHAPNSRSSTLHRHACSPTTPSQRSLKPTTSRSHASRTRFNAIHSCVHHTQGFPASRSPHATYAGWSRTGVRPSPYQRNRINPWEIRTFRFKAIMADVSTRDTMSRQSDLATRCREVGFHQRKHRAKPL